MSWTLLLGLVLALGVALCAALSRRAELRRMRKTLARRERSVREGSEQARLSHPVVDLSRCLGCGTCVAVCPEENVLELVHGQAMVVNGARCVGHAACERECPVGAVTVTIANLETRRDVPALAGLEAVGSPGLFLAGEVTAHALIRTAIEQGAAVANEVALRAKDAPASDGALDLCIVGAGPAGLACSLEAKRLGLSFVTLDQETVVGGTVAKYPRRKLVLTEPVSLPLFGRLDQRAYEKEELIGIWQSIAREHDLPIRGGEVFEGLHSGDDGAFTVRTRAGSIRARHVCLALGRRGVPRRLGVPGEGLPKVAYSLLDANSYQGRRVLVVGGGDSAVETALGLAEQPGNEVTLSYRRSAFIRVRTRNEEKLNQRVGEGSIRVLFDSEVARIGADAVALAVRNGHGEKTVEIANDEVFVMAGGTPPVELLERAGVSFDPAQRPASEPIGEQGTGLVQALAAAFGMAVVALAWALVHRDYYLLEAAQRPLHPDHHFLRPGFGAGLAFGVASVALVGLNLLYLLRRSPRVAFRLGSLQLWMTSHVATGILAFLCAMLHGAMAPGDTVGGHAFWALAVLLLTGAVGRYFYAYVPRAANGRELELAEVKAELAHLSGEWDAGHRRFRERAHREVDALIEKRQWRGSFAGRVAALLGVQTDLRRVLARLAEQGREAGVPEEQVQETLWLARRAHRTALMAAHFEDLRAILASWRWLHRWVAALMVLLLIVHIVSALAFRALL